jgi:hypothetical protein
MLGAVRAALEATHETLKTYESKAISPPKEKTNTPWSYWNEQKDSFRAWLAETTLKPYIELKVKEREEKAFKEKVKAEQENNLELSLERCRNLITYFNEVERALLGHGAKTWAELNPVAAAAQEPLKKNAAADGTLPSVATQNAALVSESADFLVKNYKTPSVPLTFNIYDGEWSTDPAPVHTIPLCEELFEACWKGNTERIKELCLPPKTGKRDNDAVYLQITCKVQFKPSIVSPPHLDDKVHAEISSFKEYPPEAQYVYGMSIKSLIISVL